MLNLREQSDAAKVKVHVVCEPTMRLEVRFHCGGFEPD